MPTASTLDDLFIAKIVADPDCDTTRLAYADWLDEHAQEKSADCPQCSDSMRWSNNYERWYCGACGIYPGMPVVEKGNDFADRAEVIRLQCEWERLKSIAHPNTDEGRVETIRIVALATRARVILNKHPEWFTLCPNCKGKIQLGVGNCTFCANGKHGLATGRVGTFRRGFVHSVRVPTIASVLQRGRHGCKACEGLGYVDGLQYRDENCPECGGNHEPTPYATRLFEQFGTVREVVPVDRVPAEVSYLSRTYYAFDNWGDFGDYPHYLPTIIINSMTGLFLRDVGQKAYDTCEAAIAALGQALADVLRAKCHAVT